MLLALTRWLVPAVCASLALLRLAACQWRHRAMVAALRLRPVAGLAMGSQLVLRLLNMVAAVVATVRFLAGALDRVLPPGDVLGGLAGRWGLQILAIVVAR